MKAYVNRMDNVKIKTLIIVLTIFYTAGIVDASTCSPNCLNSTETPIGPSCNETSGECLYGCVPVYTGTQCLISCGENCVNCSISDGTVNETVCNQCQPNHYKNGSRCDPCSDNCQTNSTSSDSKCGQEDGRCELGCRKNYYGGQCDLNCSSNCLENVTSELPSCDRDDGKCSYGCVSSFHGDQCEIPCSATCRQNDTMNATICRQSDGHCESGCLSGWFSTQCNETCSAGCAVDNTLVNATCGQDNGYCDLGCLDEYYEETCTETCSPHCKQNNASSRTCNETTGVCLFSCVNGYFDAKCDKQCSAGCAVNGTSGSQNDTSYVPVCDPADGTCTFGCDNSSYLADCSGTCSKHCLQNNSSDIRACNETDGYCEFGCENRYFGLRCDMVCNSNCLENATSDQPTCDRLDGTCTFGCKDKYYGPKCNRPCDNKCDQELCERDGICSVGCRFPFLGGPRCDQSCSKGCSGPDTECDHHFICKKGCKLNYWGPTCQPCSSNCLNSSAPSVAKCLVSDGFCQFGCSVGKYGRTCSETCPEHCKYRICNQTTGECLNKCNKGHFGDYCNNTCSRNCPDKDCYPENGTCVEETCLVAQYAWYGPSCDLRCPRNCKDEICDRERGHCLHRCVAGYFGELCDTVCLEGTYGENCSKNCSQGCVNNTCDADSGECKPCVEPYLGARCEERMIPTQPPTTEDLPVVSGSVGGAAALLLIVGAVVLCVWRKKKKEEIVRRRKPKNRKAFSEVIRQTFFSKSIAGPRRILVDNLLARVKEMSPTDFETDFNDIEDASVEKSDSTAKLAENLSKNCFLDVYPYNGNRVVLRPLQLQVESGKEVKARYRKTMDIIKELTEMTAVEPDYINASFIEGYASSKQRYIASQGPIAVTTNDFWKMVVQEKISVVVMLTEIEERGLFKQYWPDVGGQSRYGDVSVHCVKQETHADFCLRRFNVRCYDETRPVKHLQFTSWLSDGAPPTSAAMIEFYHKFLSVEPETDTPTVVHCTSGVGRTGCFIALDLCVDEGNEDHSVDVSQCVTKLREQRVNMVQSLDQYEFLYKTVTQVLSLRSYPVDKENLKKEWKDLRKENGTLIQTTFEDLCESITLDEMDIESIVKNQGEDGKNREGSDIPEDRYRPKLASGDYINAVYIDTYKKKEGMIVTQMPTPETVNQFLRLILQEQCHVAVMMNEENPDDTSQFKYWPSYDKSTQIGDVFVTTNEILDKISYLSVKLTLSDLRRDDDTTFTLHLYQFAAWRSGDTSPKSEVACLSLIRHVLQQTDESYPGRILVHCLNGSERSGLFCALYILMEKLNYEGAISVINTVRKIKSRRANAVPNLEQFRFIYQCLVYYIENYGEEIKYKPDEQQQKRSRASSGLKRISQMYAKPDKKKKRKSELYAKPDKKKKKSQAADDRIELVTGERAASGSGVQEVYAAVDKKGKKKTDSKGETTVYDNACYNEKGKKKSEEITVTIEHPNVNNVNDVNIVVGENYHSVVYRRE